MQERARVNWAALKRNATMRRLTRRVHLHRQAERHGQTVVFFPGTVEHFQMTLLFFFFYSSSFSPPFFVIMNKGTASVFFFLSWTHEKQQILLISRSIAMLSAGENLLDIQRPVLFLSFPRCDLVHHALHLNSPAWTLKRVVIFHSFFVLYVAGCVCL